MFAIFLPAVGTAILFNIGASSGGTDIIAMILKKYSSMNIGTVLMLVDIASVVASYFIFGVETGLFSTIGLAAKSLVIDDVIEISIFANVSTSSVMIQTNLRFHYQWFKPQCYCIPRRRRFHPSR